MPQLDITTFLSQLFWLFIVTICVYLFNRLYFISKITRTINERENKILRNIEEANAMTSHIESLYSKIETLLKESKKEAYAIIEEAISKSDKIVADFRDKQNKDLTIKINNYYELLNTEKIKIYANSDAITETVKNKLTHYVTNI